MKDIADFQGCGVVSCVRQLEGHKTPSSFLIERTCRYARNNTCTLGHPKTYRKHTMTREYTIAIGTNLNVIAPQGNTQCLKE